MMRIDLISAVPDVLRSPIEHSIIKRARDAGFVDIQIHDLRDYSTDKHRKVDDYPYGGGGGMVLSPQPVFDCIESLQGEHNYDEVVFPTPDAPAYEQQDAVNFSMKKNIIILCGHYKGVDQRIRDSLVTKEYSIGDYVLSGGELPALVMVDSIVRLIPGAIGDAQSALSDSFQEILLGAPVYTRPADFRGMNVPEILQSGDHKKVEQWKHEQAIEKTKKVRPDLYENFIQEQQNQEWQQ